MSDHYPVTVNFRFLKFQGCSRYEWKDFIFKTYTDTNREHHKFFLSTTMKCAERIRKQKWKLSFLCRLARHHLFNIISSAPLFTSVSSGYSFTKPTLSLSLKKQNVIRRTISLVRLEKGRDKKVSFVPITDIIIKLNGQDDCTVTRVAELVKDEAGFDVTLVNMKCNQIVDSDATQGFDFWKSSRKVLAVQTQMFDKTFGKTRHNIVTLLI